MAYFEFVGKDHIKRGCHCQLEECSLDCSLRRKLVNKPTNADRIRAMTDEELADLLTAVAKKSAQMLCKSIKTVEVDLSKCDFEILTKTHLSWLKSPVEVEE